MRSFKDFLLWHNDRDVPPIMKENRKFVVFYHDKDIDLLKICSKLLNLANICLHESTDAKYYLFAEEDKDLLKKS